MSPEPPDQERVPRVLPADRRRVGTLADDGLPLHLREVWRHPAPRRSVPRRRQSRTDHRKRIRLPRPPYRELARRPVRGQSARTGGGAFSRSVLACQEKKPEGWVELPCSKHVRLMPPQRLGIEPEWFTCRPHDTASFEVGQVTGEVIEDTELPRSDEFVHLRNPEQSLIEGPVAHSAKCHAVGGPVVLGFAPRNDVRCRDSRVTIECANTDAAQGAAVSICCDNCPPKALIANR